MREANHLNEKSTVVSVGGRPGSTGTNNHEMGHTQGEDSTGSSLNRKFRRNKRNARQQGVEIHPDKDDSYVGNLSNVDDLVKYINNEYTAEKVKEIQSRPQAPQENPERSNKKKERNKGKAADTSEAGVISGALDAQGTSSQSECFSAKQANSRQAADSLCDKETEEMGSSSSTEKFDAKEETCESSSKVIITENEIKNQKTPKSDIHKREPNKIQKNHVVPNSKAPANTKQPKNTTDKTKTKDVDAEGTKVKNVKKGRSKTVKGSQELKNRARSPSPPVTCYDIDNAQEQWCTVVSKPQKKKRSQAQTLPVLQNCFSPVVAHQTHSKDFQTPSPYPVEIHRRNQHCTSLQKPGNKPLCYASYLKAIESGKREKDLSPSDFPVLNSSPRCYRRSLENVFDTGALISDKDSDKESSKSFPADIGLAGRTTYVVTYASMASGITVHESVDSSKAASVTSSVEETGMEFSTNSASLKWKGSPQERRHSIGSAPKDFPKNVLQRTGSQEMLHCDKDLRSPSVTIPNKISNPACKNFVSSDSTGSFTSSDADSARGSEICSEGLGEDITATSADESSKNFSGFTGKISVQNEDTLTTVNTESEKTKSTESIPVASAHCFQTINNESKLSSGAGQVNNGRKKGVVFFCNVNEQFPPMSGLYFGFYPGEEDAAVVSNSVSTMPSVPDSGEEISDSVLVDSLNSHSSSLFTSSQQLSSTTAVANSNSTSSDPTVKPPKGPHIAGLNGFISPQLLDSNADLVLHTPANFSVFNEHSKTWVESTDPGFLCSDSASNLSRESLGSSSEPKETESQKRVTECTYGQELQNKSFKNAVYFRPPEASATKEISEDHFLSFSFLGAGWKWNEIGWVTKTGEGSPAQ